MILLKGHRGRAENFVPGLTLLLTIWPPTNHLGFLGFSFSTIQNEVGRGEGSPLQSAHLPK
jgi:hypothetical protein